MQRQANDAVQDMFRLNGLAPRGSDHHELTDHEELQSRGNHVQEQELRQKLCVHGKLLHYIRLG